jgi:CDP-glucose 4,6-dehydratase
MGLMAERQISPSFWAGKRVLVTGHTGFKGTWLCLWLNELSAQVSGISLDPNTEPSLFSQLHIQENLRHHWIADVRDPLDIAILVDICQPEVVFHLAAQPLVRRSYSDPLGTWATNVQGSLHILEALRFLHHPCAVVMVTTDKVYENLEWNYGYRECDRLGGHDPYSASKAAAELAIASWRSSFCGVASHQTPYLKIATARAGNVIGGGDWADDRLVPDVIRALSAGEVVPVRFPFATRPWQHVLEPLAGYLQLAEALTTGDESCASAFNFGPLLDANRPVWELVEAALQHWPGDWRDISDQFPVHEAARLNLQIDKAYIHLGWRPRWNFSTTVERTVKWYRSVVEGCSPLDCSMSDLIAFQESKLNSS